MARVLVNLITPSTKPSLHVQNFTLYKTFSYTFACTFASSLLQMAGKLSRHYSITPPTEPLPVTLSLVKILHLNT